MTPETPTTLTPQTIDALRRLHATNRGSKAFYREAAERISLRPLRVLFTEVAGQRARHAAELSRHLEANDALADQAESTLDQLHTVWMKLRGLLNQGNPYVLLIEAERAEDRIKRAYEDLLVETAGSAMNAVLTAHHAEVKATHDRLLELRDEAKADR